MIGERIQGLRKKKGLSLTQLSENAGVAKSYLSTIERGIQTNPSIQFLEKVGIILGVSVEQILQITQDLDSNMDKLDHEWQELIHEAMKAGISKKQFKEYLEFTKWKVNCDES